MLKNYLIIAYRSLLAQKLYSIINILGLAIGLATCITMAIFVESELGYDEFIQDHERIYRSSVDFTPPNSPEQKFAQSQVFNAERFKSYFSEVEDATRLREIDLPMGQGQDQFIHEGIMLADANAIEFFSLEIIKGNPHALNLPNSVVLSESAARMYFSSTDVLGETLHLANRVPLKVTAVIKDLPNRTHLNIFALVSMATANEFFGNTQWQQDQSFNYFTYLKLAKGISGKALEAKLPDYLENHDKPGASKMKTFKLMPITDIYLHSNKYGEMKDNGDINTVYSFTIISALILLIASVNFMNLSTASAAKRAKEVGVRKTLGAKKHHLIAQFIVEAVLLSYIALFIALSLVQACLPLFAEFIGKPLEFNFYSDAAVLITLLVLGLFVGVISGSYPAFYLSSFKPARVLKGEVTQGKSGVLLRKALVVFQFSVAVILIIATIVASKQLSYARNMELGYDREKTIVLQRLYTDEASQQRAALKTQLLAHSNIVNVTASSAFPTGSIVDAYGMTNPVTNTFQTMPVLAVDEDYFNGYSIRFLSGRGFSRKFPADEFLMPSEGEDQPNFSVVINKKAADSLGYSPQEAIGKQFKAHITQGGSSLATIVGVTQDYYFSSVKSAIRPTYHMFLRERGSTLSVKYQGDTAQVREYIEKTWAMLIPGQPIELSHLEDRFEQLYHQEDKELTVFNLFAMLAIFIACLGLFGLASFTTQRRTKEIGIRKVLGASVWDIVLLINKEFSKQVLIANVLAWPIAYYIMQQWLNSFVYRIDLSLIPFLISAGLAFVIAWLTVGSLSAFAAKTRPVKSLKYE
ncbi:ABC transporter permease [Pseudoalteromonas sp. A25]|uniref:ABC transporter permease n=1 Tax=Pseudoalteromonas sp. A25 TaxID=116092 RepID=UPI001260ED9D|nr:ABC transporter permease [Pseudoalteromonas sp. A25]BBN82529.1 ABC transporter permease [Pseudoalteromonas sp. A25]